MSDFKIRRSAKNVKENSASAKTSKTSLKGFTLIELIIVIAIIGVLITIASVAIAGFIRDATIRSNNSAARQMATALQNCLIQWEIKQDDSFIDLNPSDPSIKTPALVVLSFNYASGRITNDGIYVENVDEDGNTTGTATISPTNNKPMFTMLSAAINGNIGSGASGRYDVWLGYKNAVVLEAAMSPDLKGLTDYSVWFAAYIEDTTKVPLDEQIFATLAPAAQNLGYTNLGVNRTGYKLGLRLGVYPYRDER